MLWASSYLALGRGVSAEAAAGYASLFFLGITVGRALNGFLTMRFLRRADDAARGRRWWRWARCCCCCPWARARRLPGWW